MVQKNEEELNETTDQSTEITDTDPFDSPGPQTQTVEKGEGDE